ncbi:flavoprotein [Halanaerobium hydrogeniformans]|uniref:Flavoprotein n=1 Tax=Halanaerobium hydrogeniformans TaxID=656519 RepID=E4RMA5_HALHG|nr:flavoprotein [Halanaerobium hydrogeniformans]ADQ14436.1 flavoprotein [Halanaerobium hydrogeniformans]
MLEVTEELITRLVKEVLESLNNEISQKKNIIALFTGGKVDCEKSLSQLKKIDKQFSVNWQLMFSQSAKSVLDYEYIASELGVENFLEENSFACLEDADLIVVPVLTRNTAAKISAHFADTTLIDLIFHGLMAGIPVVAARNAADLSSDIWAELGMDKIPPALLEENQKQLRKIESYGIQLIEAEAISQTVQRLLGQTEKSSAGQKSNKKVESKNTDNNTINNSIYLDSKVLTYRDINPLADEIEIVYVKENAIITPYARDVAQNKGMIICSQPE